MSQNKFDPAKAQLEVTKAIQGLMDACHFHTKDDAGHVLGMLIMQATMANDQIMGPEYAMQTLLKVAEHMQTGEPQKKAQVLMINRSQMN